MKNSRPKISPTELAKFLANIDIDEGLEGFDKDKHNCFFAPGGEFRQASFDVPNDCTAGINGNVFSIEIWKKVD